MEVKLGRRGRASQDCAMLRDQLVVPRMAAFGEIRVQHSTSMSGRQGGKLKPQKVNISFNGTDSRSL
jgi:hypothetical protein